jgi:O-antigen/teichoic acid export membrane protein
MTNKKRSIIYNYLSLLFSGLVSQGMTLAAFSILASRIEQGLFGALNFDIALISFGLLPNAGLAFHATRIVAMGNMPTAFTKSYTGLRFIIALAMYAALVVILMVLPIDQPRCLGLLLIGAMLIWQSLYLDWFFNGKEQMLITALCNLCQPLIFLFVTVSLPVKEMSFPLICFAYGVGFLVSTLVGYVVYKMKGYHSGGRLDWSQCKSVLQDGGALGLAFVVAQTYASLGTLMLNFMKGETSVALYSSAFRIVAPINAVGVLFTLAVFPVISRSFAQADWLRLSAIMRLSTKLMVSAILPIACILIVKAEAVILILFGEPYANAANPLRILSATLVIIWICMGYARFLTAAGANGKYLVAVSAAALVNLVLNFLLIPRYGASGAAVATLIAEIGSFVCMFSFAQKIHKNPFLPLLVKPLIAGICMCAVLVFLKSNLFVCVIVSALVYVLIFILLRGVNRDDLTLLILLKDA